MASSEAPDSEDLIPCPYESAHMLRRKRMQYHLIACRKQHTDAPMGRCPFNAKHHVPKVELPFHIANCPDKEIIMSNLSYNQALQSEGRPQQEAPKYEYVCAENWENETVDTYFNLCSGGNINAYTKPKDSVRPPKELSDTLRLSLPPGAAPPSNTQQTNGGGRSGVNNRATISGKSFSSPAMTSQTAAFGGQPRLLGDILPQPIMGYGRGQQPQKTATTPMVGGSSKVTAQVQPQARTASTTAAFSLASLAPTNRAAAGQSQKSGKQLQPSRSQPTVHSSASTSSIISTDSPSRSDDEESDPLKVKRKLEKKLKQIEQLERDLHSGKTLDSNQTAKVASKNSILEQLEDLQL